MTGAEGAKVNVMWAKKGKKNNKKKKKKKRKEGKKQERRKGKEITICVLYCSVHDDDRYHIQIIYYILCAICYLLCNSWQITTDNSTKTKK